MDIQNKQTKYLQRIENILFVNKYEYRKYYGYHKPYKNVRISCKIYN